ncbi:MAG: sigma 54-interacting transcriptional regulator, partial [Acidobacteriota bacterium]
ELLSASQAAAYRVLVEAAARLLALVAHREPVRSRAERDRLSGPPEPPEPPKPPTVVARVRTIYANAARVARGEVGVLITGESGTGKEVLARYIHRASPRRDEPFVAINCAALPRDLLEAELFGIEQGVATGVRSRPGKFELADGGTLFLDEIADMAPETQAKILRVLQEGEVYRVGGQEPRSARVRVLAATNQDVDRAMADGRFRGDLYHRIADWRVELPPLRERRGDVPNLAAFFLQREARKLGLRVAGISRGAMERLRAASWPGNIRQLEREMARAVLFVGEGELLESSHLRTEIDGPGAGARGGAGGSGGSLTERMERWERLEIEQVIAEHGGNLSAVARALDIGRSTLYRRIEALGIETG